MLATAIIMLTSCQTKRTYSNDITTLSDQASSTTVVNITKETAVQAATVPATADLTAVSATAAATTKRLPTRTRQHSHTALTRTGSVSRKTLTSAFILRA